MTLKNQLSVMYLNKKIQAEVSISETETKPIKGVVTEIKDHSNNDKIMIDFRLRGEYIALKVDLYRNDKYSDEIFLEYLSKKIQILN